MGDIRKRIVHLKGSPREIGIVNGRFLGKRLEENINRYIQGRPRHPEILDRVQLQAEALPFLHRLPLRFQEELQGMSEGAGIPLQRIAEWVAVEQCVHDSCSGLITSIGGHAWVARNNDFRVPDAWGYVTIREVNNRIPTISFGMEGDVFTATGMNREQLWIHSQFLPVDDTPQPNKAHLPGYVILMEALETCVTIRDVENLLKSMDRDSGMLLFIVDGKTNESALLECTCREYSRREPVRGGLIGTNHSCNTKPADVNESSVRRLERLTELVDRNDWGIVIPPEGLITILADDGVEQRGGDFITVEAAVACPGEKSMWYTLGGYPAASRGNWSGIEWPW